jgi:ABC-type transport system involved in multi-copper enzyme maturation permease subunit
MNDVIRSEYRKIRTTRTLPGLLVGTLLLSGLATWGIVASASATELATALSSPKALYAAVAIVPIFILVLAVRSFTDEVRYGSLVPTVLATPKRTPVLLAKLLVIAGASIVFVVAAMAFATGIAAALLVSRGAAISIDVGAVIALTGKVVVVSMLWSALGVSIGAAVRHQVAAIVGALAWLLVVENLVLGFAPQWGQWLPGSAAGSVIGMFEGSPQLSVAAGFVVLVAWAAGAVALAWALLVKRDVA